MDNSCPLPLVILSAASRPRRDAHSKSPSRACRGACLQLAQGAILTRPHFSTTQLLYLYIRAHKSFAINQYLYIQNRNPFAISESSVFERSAPHLQNRVARPLPGFVYTCPEVLCLQSIFVYTEPQPLCHQRIAGFRVDGVSITIRGPSGRREKGRQVGAWPTAPTSNLAPRPGTYAV
jgi:hypothetical protein